MGTKGHERTTSPQGRPLSCLPPSFLSSSSFSSFGFLFVQAHSNKDLLFLLYYFKPSLKLSFILAGPSLGAFLPLPSLQSKPATNLLTVPALIISCSPCTGSFTIVSQECGGGGLGCQEVQEWSLLTWEPFPALMLPVPCPSVPGALSLFSPGENPSPD